LKKFDMETEATYNGLTMKGHIRTNEKCPKCQDKFQETPKGFVCPECLTFPGRFFVDIHIKGERSKIYSDEMGQLVDSYERAVRLLAHIRWEIDNLKFTIEKYKRPNVPFQMETYAKNWLKEQGIRLRSNEISYATFYKGNMVIERYIIPHFGITDIRQIGTRGVKDFNLHLAGTKVKGGNLMSIKYREFVMGLLRQMYYDGMRSGDLSRAQIPVFPVIKTEDKYFDVLTEEEQDEILAEAPEYDYPILHLIIYYGLRPSEARALRRDVVIGDFDAIVIRRTFTRNNRLRENPKQNRWRKVSLLDETKAILRSLPVSLNGYVFINKWGRHYSQKYVNDVWNNACKDAGYNYIPLKNASRHSLGTKLAEEGHGKDIIAEVLGHSDTKVTKHYTRYASDSLKPFFKRRQVKKGTVRGLSVEEK
jgi:integrase